MADYTTTPTSAHIEGYYTFKKFQHTINLEARQRFSSFRVSNYWNSLTAEEVCSENVKELNVLIRRDLADDLFNFA